ncbi:MAG: sulfotransferase domain-containing protein [Marinoscillum sp.]
MAFLKGIKKKIFRKKRDPVPIREDDQFLVSYPKSGNTWARFILANILKTEEDEVDFNNAVKFVPEYGVHDEVIRELKGSRILKSHEPYRAEFKHVAYLVRDPRDVYVSYFHYLQKKLPEGTTFSQFLRKSDIHPCRWHEHVASWLDKPGVHVFRYEEMIENTYPEVSRLVKTLSMSANEKKIREAISASSVDQMKRIEKEKGRPFKNEKDRENASTFVRKGTKGDWKNHFSEEDLLYLREEAGVVAERVGYKL